MTLPEAVASGKPFRRGSWHECVTARIEGGWRFDMYVQTLTGKPWLSSQGSKMDVEDAIAEDWQVVE